MVFRTAKRWNPLTRNCEGKVQLWQHHARYLSRYSILHPQHREKSSRTIGHVSKHKRIIMKRNRFVKEFNYSPAYICEIPQWASFRVGISQNLTALKRNTISHTLTPIKYVNSNKILSWNLGWDYILKMMRVDIFFIKPSLS